MGIDGSQQPDLDECIDRFVGLETRRVNGHGVGSRLEVNDTEIPVTVGLGSLLCVGSIVDDSDGRAADDGAGGVDHGASYGAIYGSLGVGIRGNQDTKQD